MLPRQELTKAKRIVIKVGTSTLIIIQEIKYLKNRTSST